MMSGEQTEMPVIECVDENGKVARGEDAQTELEVAETRNLFIYELIKVNFSSNLECFKVNNSVIARRIHIIISINSNY